MTQRKWTVTVSKTIFQDKINFILVTVILSLKIFSLEKGILKMPVVGRLN